MKKRSLYILCLLVVLGVIFGFTKLPEIIDANIETKQAKEEVVKDVEENISVLSSQDKSVKEEIAKHFNTTIDFRYEKNEKINDKSFVLKFSRMGCITSQNELSNVTYKSDNGDEVSYDLETGRITMAYLHSCETEKNAGSIDIAEAETIAYNYASKNCDIKQYVVEEKEERDNGYMFSYCKYIYGYKTNDRVRVLVGFDGSVVWTAIRFYAIDEDEFNVNEKWFEQQINELNKPNYDTIIEDTWIERDGDKVYFCIKNKMKNLKTGSVSASVSQIEISKAG